MALGVYISIAISTVAGYLGALAIAWWWYGRHPRERTFFQLKHVERRRLEHANAHALAVRLRTDPAWRQCFLQGGHQFPHVMASIHRTLAASDDEFVSADETSTPVVSNCLQRLINLTISRLPDAELVWIAKALHVATPASALEDLRGRHQLLGIALRRFVTWGGLGLLACTLMFLFPPWQRVHEHSVSSLQGSTHRTIVSSDHIGYQWLFSASLPPDQYQHVATENLSLFEGMRRRTCVDSVRLMFQQLVAMLIVFPLALRHWFYTIP